MKAKQLGIRIAALLAALLLLLGVVLGGQGIVAAFAAGRTQYTTVLEDLGQDEEFTLDDYPDDFEDYTIQVRQIAESEDGELFIYTYQPAQKLIYLVASYVNMSLAKDIDTPQLYALKLLSCEGVLCKYMVQDFTVSSDDVRYYNITSIYRQYVPGVDAEPEKGSTINGIGIGVGQLWTVTTIENGVVTYNVQDIEFLDVTKQWVAYIEYSGSMKWKDNTDCHAHFFAFNCDHEIDYLLNAEIEFTTEDYKASAMDHDKYPIKLSGNPVSHHIVVDHTMSGAFDGGIYGKHKWERLTSTEDFLKKTNYHFSDEFDARLRSYDWLINFYETPYVIEAGGRELLVSVLAPFGFIYGFVKARTQRGTLVTNVALLRLEFSHEGKVYNLGVVSNIESGSQNPANRGGKDSLPWWAWLLIAVVGVLVLGIVLKIFGVLGKVLHVIWLVLWWTVCLPFRGIAWIIRKSTGREKKKGNTKTTKKKGSKA